MFNKITKKIKNMHLLSGGMGIFIGFFILSLVLHDYFNLPERGRDMFWGGIILGFVVIVGAYGYGEKKGKMAKKEIDPEQVVSEFGGVVVCLSSLHVRSISWPQSLLPYPKNVIKSSINHLKDDYEITLLTISDDEEKKSITNKLSALNVGLELLNKFVDDQMAFDSADEMKALYDKADKCTRK